MEQIEDFSCRFKGIKPGWIFDPKYRRMTEIDVAATKKCQGEIDSLSLCHNSLRNILFEEKTTNEPKRRERTWKNDFIKAKEKYCFLIRVYTSYLETLECQNSIAKGTVTEVRYRRSILILVCSEDEDSEVACSSYIKNIIAGIEAELNEITCFSCKKCFIYDECVAGDPKTRSFDSVMPCLKEASRIIEEEMKKGENFGLWSWMYLIKNYLKEETLPVDESLSEKRPFKITKLLNATETSYQCPGILSAQHNFGDNIGKHRFPHSNVTDETSNNTIIGINKSTLSVSLHSNSLNSSTLAPLSSIHSGIVTPGDSEKPSSYESSKENFIASKERVTANKAHDVTKSLLTTHGSSDLAEANMVTPKTSLIDGSPKVVIKDIESHKESMLITGTSNAPNQNVYETKSNTTSNMQESTTLNENLPRYFVYINEDAHLAHPPTPISNKCTSVLEEGIKSQGSKESIDNYEKSNVLAEESEINEWENYQKKSKENCKKRISVAEQITLNGPSKLEPCSNDRHQVKKHKTENFVEYFGKKIARTVVEKDGIRKVKIGTKICEQKGKVIILLGATGSGKSSIVNLCANFYFGSQNADDKKLFIVDPKVKTDRVTVYTFYPQGESQFPLTVVDTPGLNDSTGAEIHDHVDALKSFLALACSQGMEINAICFLAQAHLVRLTSSEKFVMDYVRSLFGSEVEKHIMVFVTFSDHQPIPPVIEAMEQYGFAKPFFVKFNNTLLISETESVDDLDRIYWRTGFKSWKKCLKHLSVVDPLSNVAISSVKNEVLNTSVINKRKSNLVAEIRNFITMCYSKKTVEEFYSDKELVRARYKLWMASNDAYSVEASKPDKTKELFLIDACQLQLRNESKLVRSAVIQLFLLLDQESSLSCVLTNLVSAFLKCHDIFYVHSKALGNSLTTFCNGCDNDCKYEKLYTGQSDLSMKFKCNCSHSSGLHGRSSETFCLQLFEKNQLYLNTVRSIRREILKYGLNCEVDGLWTVGEVLRNLQLSKPDKYGKDNITKIFGMLNQLVARTSVRI